MLEIALPGRHQVANAALAALAALALPGENVDLEQVRAGLARWRWPGRLERPRPDLPLLFDCGHNREGGRSLAAALRAGFPGRPVELVVGMVDKKDQAAFFREMRRVVDHVRIAPPSTSRAASREVLEAAAAEAGLEVMRAETIGAALRAALQRSEGSDRPLVVLARTLFTLEDGYRACGVSPPERLWNEGSDRDTARSATHAYG
jgi:dihydrofolate synthase/folylpolyglutamate synthase